MAKNKTVEMQSEEKRMKADSMQFHLIEHNNRDIPTLEERKMSGKDYLFLY